MALELIKVVMVREPVIMTAMKMVRNKHFFSTTLVMLPLMLWILRGNPFIILVLCVWEVGYDVEFLHLFLRCGDANL